MKVIIREGKVIGFEEDIKELFGEAERKRRASYILPKPLLLKVLFLFLRKLFGDEGKIAEWTRSWNCEWELYIYAGTYRRRKEALAKEREILNKLGEEVLDDDEL